MISHEKQCIFIHIPKCGGTTIEDIIWPGIEERNAADLWGLTTKTGNKYQSGGLQHLLAAQIKEEVGHEIFNAYFKFSFVRNPFDRLVSQYSYTKQHRWDLRKYLGMKDDASFKKYLKLIRKKKHVQWEPQYKFLYDASGNLLVDYIGKIENFNQGIEDVLSNLNMNITDIPHKKKSDHKPFEEYYDRETRQMVIDLFEKDFELLNYHF